MRAPLAFLMTAGLLAGASEARAQGAALWGCDAPLGRTCYFSLQFASGGVRNFSLQSGQRMAVAGVTPLRDRYQVSIGIPNLGDVNRCRTIMVRGFSCLGKVVDPAYND